jgi:hypothetical protein
MVREPGSRHLEPSEIPFSSAAASVKTLNALPAWRRLWLARLNSMSRRPGANAVIARIAPLAGSIATSAAAGSELRLSRP